MSIKKTLLFYFALILLATSCATHPLQKISHKERSRILSKPTETWKIEECEAIINTFSTANSDWDIEHPVDHSLYGMTISIKATPFTRDVVRAIVRKEAIERRFSVEKFRERLKEELESFTNYSLDAQTGEIIPKPRNAKNYLNEYIFKIYFVNVSDPYRTIEVYRAEEGFFLERDDGKFTRVSEISGIDTFFRLTDDLYTMVTFSAFTDDGERLEFNERTMPRFKLVFTSLQKKPIELEWKKINR
jgi:hypothetical protein